MTGIFLGHSGENEHLSSIRIIPGTRLGTRVTPRSQLPPNKGDRSSAYKLKEKLDMYQARHEMGLGPKMICFQRIVELELVWDMNCSFFDTHTHNHWWFERVGFVWCTLKVAFRWAEDDTSIPETSTACSLFGSKPPGTGFQDDLMWANIFPKLSQEHAERRRCSFHVFLKIICSNSCYQSVRQRRTRCNNCC